MKFWEQVYLRIHTLDFPPNSCYFILIVIFKDTVQVGPSRNHLLKIVHKLDVNSTTVSLMCRAYSLPTKQTGQPSCSVMLSGILFYCYCYIGI